MNNAETEKPSEVISRNDADEDEDDDDPENRRCIGADRSTETVVTGDASQTKHNHDAE